MFKTLVVMSLCMVVLFQSAPEAKADDPLHAIPNAFGDVARSFIGNGGSRLVRRSADVQPDMPTNPMSTPISPEVPSKK